MIYRAKQMQRFGLFILVSLASLSLHAVEPEWSRIGMTPEKLEPSYWLEKAPVPNTVLMTPETITQRNARVLSQEPSMVYWPNWPDTLSADAIRARILSLSSLPSGSLFVHEDKPIAKADTEQWLHNLALEAITPADDHDFGLIVQRTSVRRFPTGMPAHDWRGGRDIDRLQESALFPGTPVAVLHESRDKQWLFVQADTYAGWVAADAVAMAARDTVMAYAQKTPRLYVTGAQVRTVFHPYAREVSEKVLDMGTNLPLLTDWPLSKPVNGQGTLGGWVVEMPLRSNNGLLHFKPVLIARSADVRTSPMPATAGTLLQQSFKFLGERYGWGHDYNGRDCSGFVSEVYRSIGIQMPRNTGDQARSVQFERMVFKGLTPSQRLQALKQLRIGDLIYIPGHVMMVIGQEPEGPWVIHDVQKAGMRIDGKFWPLPLNSVAVTPLLPLASGPETPFIEAITVVQRLLPVAEN